MTEVYGAAHLELELANPKSSAPDDESDPLFLEVYPSLKRLPSPSNEHLPCALPDSLREEYNVEILPMTMSTADIIRRKIDKESIVEGPFYIVDLGVLARQYQKWVTLMPRVKPFYAVKCNPEPALIKTLAALGAGFDCASQGEITQVLSYGVEPERIIMANPCKPPSHIVAAKNYGVSRMTFDNVDELQKIKKCFPNAECVLRILPDDSHSVMRFGTKFGAPVSSWANIFKAARDLSLKVVGISFHVGSGCMSAQAFSEALKLARAAFDVAEQFGFCLTLLDIGGGFPGNDNDTRVSFPEIAEAIVPVLEELFPSYIDVIGEPGRYMASETHSLAATVCSRRYVEPAPGDKEDALRYLYYINDGVYGSFNCIFFDHAHPTPIPLKVDSETPLVNCKVFGPTCDSLDVVAALHPLPEMAIGDWMYFNSMGAYTTAAASAFNGFKTKTMFYVYTSA